MDLSNSAESAGTEIETTVIAVAIEIAKLNRVIVHRIKKLKKLRIKPRFIQPRNESHEQFMLMFVLQKGQRKL
jgi:hypothetical protein